MLTALQPSAGGRYIDGTLGAGGHAAGILEASSPDGQLLGLDLDPVAIAMAAKRLRSYGHRAQLRHGSFAVLAEFCAEEGWVSVHGILLDLGLSSMQLDDASRGFSFQLDGPLDMRFDVRLEVSADDIVNRWPEAELADTIWRYGEERASRRIARAIVRARPIHSTRALADIVSAAVGESGDRSRTKPRTWGARRRHPATRTFQALRIAVNTELEALEAALPKAVDLLAPGGRLAVIAFHSLEDRIVKRFMRTESSGCHCPPEQPVCTCGAEARLRIITRRPIRPQADEVEANPRSRSARLRAAQRLGPDQDVE